MMGNETIHIALAVYDPHGTYSRHAGVTMASVLKNTKSKVCFHMLHDTTLTKDNKNLLHKTAQELGGDIKFIDVTDVIKERTCADLEELAKIYTQGALFRLLIPDVVKLNKILYLDCDIVVNMDIKQLWDISVNGYCLAAVKDVYIPDEFQQRNPFSSDLRFRMWVMDMPLDNYFNTGVLSMNLLKIRDTTDLFDKGVEFIEHYKQCSLFPDQDFLNSAFAKYTRCIDVKFNSYGCLLGKNEDVSDKIIHFVSREKPWTSHNEDSPANKLYWRYFSCTAWKDHITDYILDVPAQKRELRSSDCIKYLKQRFILNLKESLPVRMVQFIYNRDLYSLKYKK